MSDGYVARAIKATTKSSIVFSRGRMGEWKWAGLYVGRWQVFCFWWHPGISWLRLGSWRLEGLDRTFLSRDN